MRTQMRPIAKHIRVLLCVALAAGGCATLRSLESQAQREYVIELEPVLPEGDTYYIDPIDSSVVWSEQGVQVKVKFYDDAMLDAEYGTRFTPYTLTGVEIPGLDYTPPLWTVFEVTVINRTRERVELDPTQTILRLGDGRRLLCRQGAGNWYDKDEFFDYSYLKWGGQEGNVKYHASLDRNPIWDKSEYSREKPVRKGYIYSGKLTFPPLPAETRSFTLEVNEFILAFDRFQVGYGNPTEFTDLKFHFNVDHGVRWVENSP